MKPLFLHVRNEGFIPARVASRRPGARGERHIQGGPVGKIRSSEPGAGAFDEQFDGHGQRGTVTPTGVPETRTRLLRTRRDFPSCFPRRGNEHRARPRILHRWPRLSGGAQSQRSPVSPLLPANLPPRPATAGCRQRPLPNGLNSGIDSEVGRQPVRVASEVDMVGLHLVRPRTVLRSGRLPRIPVDLRAGCAGLQPRDRLLILRSPPPANTSGHDSMSCSSLPPT